MHKKALITTYYWPPSGGAGVQRPLKFAKYLPQFDIKPIILTVENPTYPILDESLKKDVSKSLQVYKSGTVEPFSLYSKLTGTPVEDSTKPTIQLKSRNWQTRLSAWIRANIFLPDARVGWLLTGRSKALSIVKEQQIDTIITTGPPHSVHFIGKRVKEETGIQWIADFRDPWTGVYYNQLMPRASFAQNIDERLERSVLETADEVIVISDSMAAIQKKIFNRRYHVIPNGFDPDDYQFEDISSDKSSGKKIIRFIGSVREGAVPDGFLKALARVNERSQLKVEFIGNAHPSLESWIKKLKLDDIAELKSYVPHDEAIRTMCTADLLLLSINKTPGSELILTGKLFEYLGSGNPILFLGPTSGDAAKIIREADQGTCFKHDEVDKITRYLEEFAASDRRQGAANHVAERDHPYSRIQLTKQLAELITQPS